MTRLGWPSFDERTVLRRSRLLVVDDQEFPYLELFRADGYAIDKWDDIDDLPSIEQGNFDLVLIDLQGVGTKISEDQGLGVLKYLRENFPTVITIAYSNADWRLKYQSFFESADAALDKSADYLAFKERVRSLLLRRTDFDFYVERANEIAGVDLTGDRRTKRIFRRALLPSTGPDHRERLRHELNDRLDDQSVDRIIQLCQLGAAGLQVLLVS